MATWLAERLVARWWNHETTPEAVERDFGPSVDGRDPTDMFLAYSADRPFGLIQRYVISAYPEYLEELSPVCPVTPEAISVDYLVGDPSARRTGLGAAMIATLVADCWARYPYAQEVIVPVAAGNVASWRALERAGFARFAEGDLEPDNPRDPRDHYLYRIDRPAGWPTRFSAVCSPKVLAFSAGIVAGMSGGQIGPGATDFTRCPSPASARADPGITTRDDRLLPSSRPWPR